MITILELASASGAQAEKDGSYTAEELARVGFDLLGGCESCEATLAAYNAFPSRTGNWRCRGCIDDRLGFQTAAEFFAWAKGRDGR